MSSFEVDLTINQKSELKQISNLGRRGEFIAKCYLIGKFPKISFKTKITPGADLTVDLDGNEISFEVKSTKDAHIAINKLRVSSQNSHDLIVKGMTVLRVMKVDTDVPTILELHHGQDFCLKKRNAGVQFSLKTPNKSLKRTNNSWFLLLRRLF